MARPVASRKSHKPARTNVLRSFSASDLCGTELCGRDEVDAVDLVDEVVDDDVDEGVEIGEDALAINASSPVC
jgi:hypothetical protein